MTAAAPAPVDARRRVTGLGGDVIVLAVAAIASTCAFATVARWYNLTAVVAGVVAVALVVVWRAVAPPHWWSIVVGALATLVPQWVRPQTDQVLRRSLLPVSVTLAFVAVVVLIIAVLPFAARARRWLIVIVFALAAAGLVLVIAGSDAPIIDVWQIFQQASAGLFHGVNPYDRTYAHIPPGQTADCYNYLPATLLVSWVGWVSLDEVRYAELLVLAAGWFTFGLAGWRRCPSSAPRLRFLTVLAFAVVLVGGMRVAQQGWNESIALGFVLLAVGLTALGRVWWAVLALALALATKQHMVLLLPLFCLWPAFGWRRSAGAVVLAVAIGLPWLVWNPARFTHCTVGFFVQLPARDDSLSLWQYLPGPFGTVLVVALVVLALVAASRFLPRSPGGVLLGGGLTLACFDLVNKQTFQNQWWIAGQLLLCGLAWWCVDERATRSGEPQP